MKKNLHGKLMYNRVSQVRKSLGLTQSELASMVGTTRNTISAIETYVFCPSLPLCFALCYCLSTSFDQLFIPSDGFEKELCSRKSKVFPLENEYCFTGLDFLNSDFIPDFDDDLPF